MIITEGLTVFDKTNHGILQYVWLTAVPGEITFIAGPDIEGISTLLLCAAGLKNYKGKIRICGFDVKSLEARKRTGYVFANPVFYELLTLKEHIDFIGKAYEITDYQKKSGILLTALGLSEYMNTSVHSLTILQQRRLALLLALLTEPAALLIDGNILQCDHDYHLIMAEMILTLKRKKTSILISIGQLNETQLPWDKAYLMENGQITEILLPDHKNEGRIK